MRIILETATIHDIPILTFAPEADMERDAVAWFCEHLRGDGRDE